MLDRVGTRKVGHLTFEETTAQHLKPRNTSSSPENLDLSPGKKMIVSRCDAFRPSVHNGAELYGFDDFKPQQPEMPLHFDAIYKHLVTLVKESNPCIDDWTCSPLTRAETGSIQPRPHQGQAVSTVDKGGLYHTTDRIRRLRSNSLVPPTADVGSVTLLQTASKPSRESPLPSGSSSPPVAQLDHSVPFLLTRQHWTENGLPPGFRPDKILHEIAKLADTPIDGTAKEKNVKLSTSSGSRRDAGRFDGSLENRSNNVPCKNASHSNGVTVKKDTAKNLPLQHPSPALTCDTAAVCGPEQTLPTKAVTGVKKSLATPAVPGRFFTTTRRSVGSTLSLATDQKSMGSTEACKGSQLETEFLINPFSEKCCEVLSLEDVRMSSIHQGQYSPGVQVDTECATLHNEARGDLMLLVKENGRHQVVNVQENSRTAVDSNHNLHLPRKGRNGSDRAGLPSTPKNVRLMVASESSLSVRFDSGDSSESMATQYKVEWSCDPSFRMLSGLFTLSHRSSAECEIRNLIQGTPYHVRVSAYNENGCSTPAVSEPLFATPSSWRDVHEVKSRTKGQLAKVNKLYEAYKILKPPADNVSPADSPTYGRKVLAAKRGIKGLFSSAVKFHRTLKRGVYLACLFYNEDRVLVTSEDALPTVEVDDGYPGTSTLVDFHWLVKVSCGAWDAVRELQQSVGKLAAASGALDLRLKMLQAAARLQMALGVQELGQMYFKPVRCTSDVIVLVVVNHISDTKSVSASSVKWSSLIKLHRHSVVSSFISSSDGGGGEENEPETGHADAIMQRLQEIICYHRVSSFPLAKGLYLGFLKASVSVDNVKLLVSESTPNVLPHVRLRSRSHVSKAEWQWLQDAPTAAPTSVTGDISEEVRRFKKLIVKGANRLMDSLGISQEESAVHRLHTTEVLELSPEVSFIVVMPPKEHVCSVQNHEQPEAYGSGYFYIPVKVFDMIHLLTYMESYTRIYSKMACRVDLEALLAQQSLRQAFSGDELETARRRTKEVAYYQQQLEATWQAVRWTTDVLTRGREKGGGGSEVALGELLLVSDTWQSSGGTAVSAKRSMSQRGSDGDTDTGYHSDRTDAPPLDLLLPALRSEDNQLQLMPSPQNTVPLPFGIPSSPETVAQKSGGVACSGVLRVYAAYDCGLARGTNVLLHATHKTTAREVIDLVVDQLRQAALRIRAFAHDEDTNFLPAFCLVAVVGRRERVLREDYAPLQLKEPWVKGRLYIRQKDNLLAAVEHECGDTLAC